MTPTHALLARLPSDEMGVISARYETVTLDTGQVLCRPGTQLQQIYMPLEGYLVMTAGSDAHDALGIGVIGREGLTGASLVLGVDRAPLQVHAELGGTAIRMNTVDFREALVACPVFTRRVRTALYQEINLLAHTSVCAVFHVVDVRLAYWLLMIQDCVGSSEFTLTHDRLARMLGVRRSGVTAAAGQLQQRRLISYRRGHIKILDRAGLEKVSCSCFHSLRNTRREIATSERHRTILSVA